MPPRALNPLLNLATLTPDCGVSANDFQCRLLSLLSLLHVLGAVLVVILILVIAFALRAWYAGRNTRDIPPPKHETHPMTELPPNLPPDPPPGSQLQPPTIANPALGRVLGVIPARLASTRLPRKVLRTIAGEPLLAWVYKAALACPALDDLIIATDSEEVQQLCLERGWPSLLTSADLPSGTDRLYAVSQQPAWNDFAIYVNIQGDEPLLHPAHITAILEPFTKPHSAVAPHIDVTTLKVRCTPENIRNPNAVKVVTATDGRALYFSRATIPYDRDGSFPHSPAFTHARYWKHLGLYAYRHAALQRFAAFPPSELEQTERLEQLRLLENGLSMYVAETTHDTIGVDTEEDLLRVEQILLNQKP